MLATLLTLAVVGAPPERLALRLAEPTYDSNSSAAGRFALEAPSDASIRKGASFVGTYYLVSTAHPDPDGHHLKDRRGAPLGARLSDRDFCDAAMQGTVRVSSGRARGFQFFGFAGTATTSQVDCTRFYPHHPTLGRARFRAVSSPRASSSAAVPYRTIAVDPAVIPLGSAVYVPQARGVMIPVRNGVIRHDGWFVASDVGGGVRGHTIDFFVGTTRTSPFAFAKGRRGDRFVAYVVEDASIARALAKQRSIEASLALLAQH